MKKKKILLANNNQKRGRKSKSGLVAMTTMLVLGASPIVTETVLGVESNTKEKEGQSSKNMTKVLDENKTHSTGNQTGITEFEVYLEGSSDFITGSFMGVDAKYMRVVVNGERKLVVTSNTLSLGTFSYYYPGLKETDKVEFILYNQEYKEVANETVLVEKAAPVKITSIDPYQERISEFLTGNLTGDYVRYMRPVINGVNSPLIVSSLLSEGKFSYYLPGLKGNDEVQLVFYDRNYKEVARESVKIEGVSEAEITSFDTYEENKTTFIRGQFTGSSVKFMRTEVNGEKRNLITDDSLSKGAFSYYLPGLKSTDKVEFVLFDASYREVVRKEVLVKSNQTTSSNYRNVMYYGDWSIWDGQGNFYPKDIPASQYSHINFAFLDMDNKGDLYLTDPDAAFSHPVGTDNAWDDTLSGVIPGLAALKKQNPNTKLGVSLGGWSKSGDFSEVTADKAKRTNFINNVLKFIKYTDMDFVDVDWEYPTNVREADLIDNKNDEGTPKATPADKENYLILMEEFRVALDKQEKEEGKTYELTTAIHGSQEHLKKQTDVNRLFKAIDFGNLMTYDFNGAWGEQTGHQTALYTNPEDPTGYSIDAVVDYLLAENVPANKIVVGSAYYSRGWDTVEVGNDAALPGLFEETQLTNKDADEEPSRGADNEVEAKVGDFGRKGGVWSFRNLDELKKDIPDLKEYWDEVAQAPYLYSATTKDFYTFDNVKSVQKKAEYVKEHQLGGMIAWMSSQDNETDTPGVRDELAKAISKELYGGQTLPVQQKDYDTKMNVDLGVKLSNADSGKRGFEFTLNNKEVQESYSSDSLRLADRYYSTIKKARLIITTKDNQPLISGNNLAGNVTVKDGKTIVDLSGVEGKYIKAGSNYSFKLARQDSSEAIVDQIAQVVLEQYYDDNTILGKQVILGEGKPDYTTDTLPVISGISNRSIKVGTSFDPLTGVKAIDQEDGDLTSSIKVEGQVDTNIAGQYKLSYSVEDKDKNKVTAERTVTVREAVTEVSNYRNVMYYGDWSIWGGQGNFYPKDVPANKYTHINFAFLDMDNKGDLYLTDPDAAFSHPVGTTNSWDDALSGVIPGLTALKKENPNTKLGVSLGGWSKSGDFSEVTADKGKRTHFINNVLKFIKYTDMDFVDVDWEYPTNVREADLVDNKNDEGTPQATPADKENYLVLMEEFRVALDKQAKEVGKTYELTTAIHGSEEHLKKQTDVSRLFKAIDFGNLMTYDYNGAWSAETGHQTALYTNPEDPTGYSIDAVVNYLIDESVPANKIVIGSAYYSRGWDSVEVGNDQTLPGLFEEAQLTNKDADQSPSRGADNEIEAVIGDFGRKGGLWSYRNLDKLKKAIPDLKEYWDDTAQAPYLYSTLTKDFYTFDNVKSVQKKAEYVKEHQLGGMIVWMSSQDKETEKPGVRDELANAISEELYEGEALPTQQKDYDLKMNVDLGVKLSGTDSGKQGFELTLNNKEVQESYTGNALKMADRFYSTIKKARLVITTKDNQPLVKGNYQAGAVTTKDGKTIVDLSGVYEGKLINAGTSYSFRLARQDNNGAVINQIEGVELQQYYDDTILLSKQMIFGETPPIQETNTAPVFSGVDAQTIKVGTIFNPMTGVTATDKEDGDLTTAIKVAGTVNTAQAGSYKLAYTVEDSHKNKVTAERVITVEAKEIVNFGVGQGIEWPAQVMAPFADMSAYVTTPDLGNNGAPNLAAISKKSGVKLFNLGFIQAQGVQNGKINWAWGGFKGLNETENEGWQYEGIKKSIRELRQDGGDVAISFGGLNHGAFWDKTQDVSVLFDAYTEIVEGYGLTRVDFDVEAGSMDYQHNVANAKAVKKLQDETGISVTLTLPVMNTGLIATGLDVLKAYLEQGVELDAVNIMTMVYGASVPDYALGSIQAIDNTMKQLQDYSQRYAGVVLTDAQAYAKIGATTSVGFEGSDHPYFSTQDMDLVVKHAIEKKLGMMSFWSINRDAMIDNGIGQIKAPYEFSTIAKQFVTK